MPKFRVVETFTLESRRLFVLAGSIIEGEIGSGMSLSVPSGSGPAKTACIHSIEFARRPDGHEYLCLCIQYAEPDELEIWRGLDIDGETLEVKTIDIG